MDTIMEPFAIPPLVNLAHLPKEINASLANWNGGNDDKETLARR
jgi:hypothetical protein